MTRRIDAWVAVFADRHPVTSDSVSLNRGMAERWARDWKGDVVHLIDEAAAARAVDALFRTTYDIVDGLRVCRFCKGRQVVDRDGHLEGCVVAAAVLEALKHLSEPKR